MKEYIQLSRHREFGDIISDTFAIIKQNFKPLLKSYFVICGLFLLTDILISAFVNSNRGDAAITTLAGLVEILFDCINHIALILTVLSYFAIYKEKGNQPAEVLEVWGYFKYYFFRITLAQILVIIAIVLGFFVCILPGIYLAVILSLVAPIMVFENGNIEYSFKRAFKIIKENWWFTLGSLLLITMIVGMGVMILLLPSIIIYGTTQWLTGQNLDKVGGILQAIEVNLCQVLWIVPIITLTLVYYTLTEEKEATSLIDRIKMFGKNAPVKKDQASSEQY
jgi:hypothetical protein